MNPRRPAAFPSRGPVPPDPAPAPRGTGSWEFDRDPLLALREGDAGPFEELVRRHSRTLLGFFRRQGVALEEAEDLVQDVMLKLHQAAPRYRAEERLQAYVFRVATHALVDRRRRAGVRPDRGARDDETLAERPAPGPGPADLAARRDERARLRAALVELSEGHRLVVELGALEGLSYAEVGSILGVPVGTVKSRMHHALRRLRDVLEGTPGRGEDGA